MGAKITPAPPGLAEALRANLEVAKGSGHGLKAIAAEMDKSYSWAAEMVRGAQPFPLAMLHVWAELTGGRNLARWVAGASGCAVADGRVTPEEVAAYEREMQEAIEKFHGLDRALNARLRRQPPPAKSATLADAEAERPRPAH